MRGPIVIGGNGGSGTRAVAEVLRSSGVYLGQDLHHSNHDDQLFVLLFKRAHLLSPGVFQNEPKHETLFALHQKMFFGTRPKGFRELGILLQASLDHALDRFQFSNWAIERWHRMRAYEVVAPDLWGWKEPNTHLFLEGLQRYYPGAKFILVMRGGLDMAFSKNHQQLGRWGAHFGLDGKNLSPSNRFEYWYRSNKMAIERASSLFGERFLSLKLEDLCLDKERALGRLMRFVGCDALERLEAVWDIPQLPSSAGRYRQFDMSWIDSDVRRKSAELGYPVEDP